MQSISLCSFLRSIGVGEKQAFCQFLLFFGSSTHSLCLFTSWLSFAWVGEFPSSVVFFSVLANCEWVFPSVCLSVCLPVAISIPTSADCSVAVQWSMNTKATANSMAMVFDFSPVELAPAHVNLADGACSVSSHGFNDSSAGQVSTYSFQHNALVRSVSSNRLVAAVHSNDSYAIFQDPHLCRTNRSCFLRCSGTYLTGSTGGEFQTPTEMVSVRQFLPSLQSKESICPSVCLYVYMSVCLYVCLAGKGLATNQTCCSRLCVCGGGGGEGVMN